MRDIIWTIIGIWVLWRIIDAFKSFSSKTSKVNSGTSNSHSYTQNTDEPQQDSPKKGHLKPDAGEYVDYEETK